MGILSTAVCIVSSLDDSNMESHNARSMEWSVGGIGSLTMETEVLVNLDLIACGCCRVARYNFVKIMERPSLRVMNL